jgi:hypothetical protein
MHTDKHGKLGADERSFSHHEGHEAREEKHKENRFSQRVKERKREEKNPQLFSFATADGADLKRQCFHPRITRIWLQETFNRLANLKC